MKCLKFFKLYYLTKIIRMSFDSEGLPVLKIDHKKTDYPKIKTNFDPRLTKRKWKISHLRFFLTFSPKYGNKLFVLKSTKD